MKRTQNYVLDMPKIGDWENMRIFYIYHNYYYHIIITLATTMSTGSL